MSSSSSRCLHGLTEEHPKLAAHSPSTSGNRSNTISRFFLAAIDYLLTDEVGMVKWVGLMEWVFLCEQLLGLEGRDATAYKPCRADSTPTFRQMTVANGPVGVVFFTCR